MTANGLEIQHRLYALKLNDSSRTTRKMWAASGLHQDHVLATPGGAGLAVPSRTGVGTDTVGWVGVTPMFPLDTVLLPGALLPLQVFEDRYRRMLNDLLADDSELLRFGVVLIERGHEVGGGDQRSNVGTLVQVVEIQVADDGRYLLVVAATERIRVTEWLPDDPYPVARVQRWPDPTAPTPDEAEEIPLLAARVDDLNAALRSLGEPTAPPGVTIADEPVLALYHLASLAPIGDADRQRVLAAPAFADRLTVMKSALDDVEATVKFRRS